MQYETSIVPFPEPMYSINELNRSAEERRVYYDIVVVCPYFIDQQAIEVLHTDGKTYPRGFDPMSVAVNAMNEHFIPVRLC